MGVLGKDSKTLSRSVWRFCSYENVFFKQVHFHDMKGFAHGLVLKQRHKVNSELAYWRPLFGGVPTRDSLRCDRFCIQSFFTPKMAQKHT